MIYICPHFDGMGPEMAPFCRLYAYPVAPEPPPPGGVVILDSGAWALAQQGRRIGPEHMKRLAEHYRRYAGGAVHAIAPDVYLDPAATMHNWEWWQKNVGFRVVPVIQFPHEHKLDFYAAYRQARFYTRWSPRVVAISNPGLQASECAELIEQVCAIVREVTGATWLHNLGAGWSPQDIRRWREIECFESIDSVAYYTDAQQHRCWRTDGGITPDDPRPWREIAVENARVAQEV